MTKKMLIDATHDEETRVAVIDDKNNRLLEFDYESQFRKPLKGSIFLAKVTRVEPSLQAAFVNFGGNRHGFLPFSEIHPDYFRIPIADREALIAEQEELLREEEEKNEEEDLKADKDDQTSDLDEDDDDDEELDEIVELNAEGPDALESAGDDDDEKPVAKKGRGGKTSKNDDSDDETVSDESDDTADAKADDNDENDDNNRGRGQRGGRGRRYNNRGGRNNRRGGRGRTKSAPYSSRKVEILGGTEYEDDNNANDRFRFNLRRKYKIQEVIKRGQIMLIQVSREERGNKGAAVTSYLSLPGRYGVLMPNSPRAGGISRKISNYKDRKRMREILRELDVPKGMSVILRTAGVARTKTEIKRDTDYLMRLWNEIRELTLESSAPSLIYEEADLIKRAVRDLYRRDVDEITVSGDEGYKNTKKFMKMMIPSHAKRVKQYKDEKVSLFHKYGVEKQIEEIGETSARLKSGGYLVINPTEALVSIDVNSGRATKERHIEETALNTNLEAAEEVARQLKLRDLGGLVVVDFIDMEDRRNNAKVERRLKEALATDRARIQIGRISSFGLLEMSRQRLNPSLTEAQFETCQHCDGRGVVRTCDAAVILLLRALEEEGTKERAAELIVHVPAEVALYILNNKREALQEIESRFGFRTLIRTDETLGADGFRIEVSKPADGYNPQDHSSSSSDNDEDDDNENDNDNNRGGRRRGRRGGRNRGGRGGRNQNDNDQADNGKDEQSSNAKADDASDDDKKDEPTKSRGGRKSSAKRTSQNSDESVKDESGTDARQDADEKPKKKSTGGRKKTPAKGKGDEASGDDQPESQDQGTEKSEDSEDQADKKPAKKAAKKAPVKKSGKTADSKPAKAAEPSNDARPPEKKEESKPVDEKPKDYEVVNEAPEKKKKGWWSL